MSVADIARAFTRTIFAPALMAAALAAPAAADEVGPAIGASVPEGFSAFDHHGAERTLADLSGEEGLVLFFVRSADWCPYCTTQLLEVKDRLEELTTAGYGVAAMTMDTVEVLQSGKVQDKEFSFPVLADPDSEIIGAWDLRDPAYPESHRRHGLPFPSTFILSADGVVKDKVLLNEQYGEDRGYRERVEFDDVAAAALAARGDS